MNMQNKGLLLRLHALMAGRGRRRSESIRFIHRTTHGDIMLRAEDAMCGRGRRNGGGGRVDPSPLRGSRRGRSGECSSLVVEVDLDVLRDAHLILVHGPEVEA